MTIRCRRRRRRHFHRQYRCRHYYRHRRQGQRRRFRYHRPHLPTKPPTHDSDVMATDDVVALLDPALLASDVAMATAAPGADDVVAYRPTDCTRSG